MKEIKEEAERHREEKFRKYGVDRKAYGGTMKKYAHGGHVHEVDLECKGKTGPEIKRAHGGEASHPHKKEDLQLIEKLEHHHMKHGGRTHRVDGGPVPRLGRGRKGGKGKTSVNIAIAPKSPDIAGAPPMPPPALGSGPSAMPPRPIIPPAAAPAGLPPRPGMGVKHGGKVHKEHDGHKKEHGHNSHHHREHRKQHH